MSNLTDFFPSGGGGGGGSTPSKSVVLIGSDVDSTQIFSPQSNGLEIGDKIFVTLMQGGQGGKIRFVGGMPTTWNNTGGDGGNFWQGYYTLTSNSDITCIAGAGGAGASGNHTVDGSNIIKIGSYGNHSVLIQNSVTIVTSDSGVNTQIQMPSWNGLSVNSQDTGERFGYTNNEIIYGGSHGPVYLGSNSPKDGTGGGGAGALRGIYNQGSLQISATRGGGGLLILNW